jgi:hypothetical protein
MPPSIPVYKNRLGKSSWHQHTLVGKYTYFIYFNRKIFLDINNSR